MMGRTLVLGSTGFVGRTIQDLVTDAGTSEDFVFAYRSSPELILEGLGSLRVDLLDGESAAQVAAFDTVVWVAGNSDHGLAWRDPKADFELSAGTMLGLLEHFHGGLTMLSSQAVYFGLSGAIPEDVDHVPTMPYGFGKLAGERYARWALDAGRLEKLWVYRLMYAFGRHEKSRRLLASCIRSSRDGSLVTVAGGGLSFLNPLPASFLGEVLLASSRELQKEPIGFSEVTNINHPNPWTVLEVVELLSTLGAFEYQVVEGGEEWPVTFHGSVDRLAGWLAKWDMSFPDVERGLAAYRKDVLRRDAQ
jgi:nucleoside-diphosphate-sugar epimerase